MAPSAVSQESVTRKMVWVPFRALVRESTELRSAYEVSVRM